MKRVEKNKVKNKELGITLIALVVTIIVLLILASITINTIVGDNSIVDKAGQAKTNADEEQILERIKSAEAIAITNSKLRIDYQILKDELKKEFGEEYTITSENKVPWKVTVGNVEYEIKDSAAGYVDGTSEESQIFELTISVDTKTFNITTGPSQVVFSVIATKNGENVYDNVVQYNVIDAEKDDIKLRLSLEEGTTVAVKAIYTGANYDIVGASEKSVTLSSTGENKVEFEIDYNNHSIINDYTKVTF